MQIGKKVLAIIAMVGFLGAACAQNINFIQNKSAAGKASLTSNAYYADFVLGAANFSPELKYPVQIFYDSAEKSESLLGASWRIPQLESAVFEEGGEIVWLSPWGEKVAFLSRKKTGKEVLGTLGESDKRGAYFSPFSDWAANGSAESGNMSIFGVNDMRGWKFSYAASKLRKIEAPSGMSIEFAYANGRPVSVSQNGKAFVEVKYSEDKTISEILVNGVAHGFEYAENNMRFLPETLAGKESGAKVRMLKKVGLDGITPLEFSYNGEGYLTQIRRGDFSDDIEVEIETPAGRKEYLRKLADARKAKKPTNKIFKERVDGRILSDSFFKYEYPSKTFSDIELTNRKGQTAHYLYDFQRGIFEVEDFSGKKTSAYLFMRYDVAYNGKIRQVLDGQKRQLANFRYNKDSGKITRARDFLQNDTNFKYDESGRLVLIEKRASDAEKALPCRAFAYEKSSQFPSKICELGEDGAAVKTVEISRDKFSRPVKIFDGENTVAISYNDFGYPVKIVNSFGQETLIAYDEFNRQISREFEGVRTKIVYGKNGEARKILTECGGETLAQTEINYDANGYAASYADLDGSVKKLERDAFGRVLKENFADNTRAEYSYDELGNLAQVIDQSGNKIKFGWNEFGLASHETAIGQTTKNSYDLYGKIYKVESSLEGGKPDRSIEYVYDEFDRVIIAQYGESEIETRKYDAWGRVVELNKNGLRTAFKYDHFGRLVEKTEGDSATKYAYDNFGRRISRITKIGADVLDEYNTYDKFGRLVKTESAGKVVEYVYNDKNRLAEQIIDGRKIAFEYTKLGQVSRKAMFDKEGKMLSELKYIYSKNGRIAARLANGKLQQYKYDAKGQLLAVLDENGNSIEEYAYDPSGNILKKTVNGETTTYSYDAANQLVKSVAPDGKITSYAYDAAGRLIQEGDKTYAYGWLDKVVSVSENGKTLATFEYHNNGQIAKAVRESGIESFEWDGLALIERNGTKYINEPHAGGGNPVLAMSGENVDAMFNDILGTSLGVAKYGGYSAIDKTSFGADSTDKSSFFTGKPYVEDLGYAFLMRNYRADLGKWQMRDLIGYPDGWNNLAYCNNAVANTFDLYGAVTIFIGGAAESLTNCMGVGVSNFVGGNRNIYTWDQKTEVITAIQIAKTSNPNERINIVGHSYGGDTAYLVARDCGYTVDNLVTLDPVSWLTIDTSKPDNVDCWVNLIPAGDSYSFGDFLADIGGQWGSQDDAINILVPNADHEDVNKMLLELFKQLPSIGNSIME